MPIKDSDLKKQLDKFASDLSGNTRMLELVGSMNPLEIVKGLQAKLDLKPKQALYLYANLLKNSLTNEWATLAINTNMQYPTPNKKQTPQDEIKKVEEDYVNDLPTYVFNNWEFPPQPRQDGKGWPYDANTTALMDPHNKGKRPLMTGLDHSDGSPTRKGNIEPGVSGQGIFQNSQLASGNGDQSDLGGTITTQGVSGWSSSPPGKEFDMPEGLDDGNMYTSQDNPQGGLVKSPVVFFGGRVPDRNMGFRKK